MKEKYVAPEMEIVEFETEDIITQSTPFSVFEDKPTGTLTQEY